MRPAIIKSFSLGMIAGSFFTAAAVLFATPAKADGYLDADEELFVELNAPAICAVITRYHSQPGVLGVAEAITDRGFSADSAVDIINASVQAYCPRNWPLLVAIGRAARAATA